MATKLTPPLHRPVSRRAHRAGTAWLRFARATGAPMPPPCPADQRLEDGAQGGASAGDWRRRALHEGLAVTLLTSLLTSAVLAAPQAFRQSPLITWRQLSVPALTADLLPARGPLVDCP